MATPFSRILAPRDHARLAQRLADDIDRLREVRLQRRDTQTEQETLSIFLADELIPYLRAEEDEVYATSADSEPVCRFRRGKDRRRNRRLREHRQLIGAANALRSTTTPVRALTDAQRVASLLDEHLEEEDRAFLAARLQMDDGSVPTLAAALTTEFHEVLARDHARVERAVSLARYVAAEDPANRVSACDRAVAALSQHASVMSTMAYPMAGRLLSSGERTRLRRMTSDLRQAERAMRHLNRLVRGAARENPDNEELLWEIVEKAWRRHIDDEEPLLRQLAPSLPPKQVVSLLASLRRPVVHSLTRPHPALLRAGWPTAVAIRVQYHIDRWRDVFDNRSS